MRKQIKSAAAAALAVMLAAANCVPVSAAGKLSLTKDDLVKALYILGYEEAPPYEVKRQPDVDTSGLPSKFDLRDVDGKNYVSPVKIQNPWLTCWSFGATAAAETSIAYEKGHDYNNDTGSDEDALFDLSEKHLAWFAYTALPEDSKEFPSQAGEGYRFTYFDEADAEEISRTVYNQGGFMNYATAVYSSGMGPNLEGVVPYEETTKKDVAGITLYVYEISPTGGFTCTKTEYDTSETTVEELRKEWTEKGYIEDETPDGAEMAYWIVSSGMSQVPLTPEQQEKMNEEMGGESQKHFIAFMDTSTGDWTLDESQRFMSFYTLKDGNMLPCPALEGENGEYIFNQAGVDAIKSEVVNGRAVSITFLADQSSPEDEIAANGESYISFVDKDGNFTKDKLAEYWTHYTYDKDYDPADKNSVNKKVSMNHAVCIVGYDDDFPKEYFRDPKGTIGGNGAFLVKNSWGDAQYNENGDLMTTWGNAGTGYFWLSYYDQSLDLPESFDFETESEYVPHNIDMYDFLPNGGLKSKSFDGDVYMANVFTAQSNCTVRCIGLESAEADIDVDYSVYLLNDDAKSPIDGELFAEDTEHFDYAGYHVVDIGKTWYLPKGAKYSIVAKAGADGKSELYYAEVFNEKDITGEGMLPGATYDMSINGIVNPGESFVGTSLEDSGAWVDWSDVVTEMRESSLEVIPHGIAYDNFPIRSYPQTEPYTIFNLNSEPEKEIYKVGDKITGYAVVQNNSGYDLSELGDISLAVNIGGVKNFPIGRISTLKPEESKMFTYEYTVTAKDAAAGKLTSTVSVLFDGVEADSGALFAETLTFTVNTEESGSSVDGASDKNPATGSEIFSLAVLAGAAAATAFVSRKRR